MVFPKKVDAQKCEGNQQTFYEAELLRPKSKKRSVLTFDKAHGVRRKILDKPQATESCQQESHVVVSLESWPDNSNRCGFL